MTIMMMLAVVIVMSSCSSSSKVGELPVSPNLSGIELPTSLGTEDTSGRSILAIYDAVIDPVARTFTIMPALRTADYHFPLTQLYPNVLQITGYGWTPNFWADIKLNHPFPGSGIDGFDARVVAILPANPGVRFNYPIFNCIGNNSVLLHPDGYIKLFDNLGGSIPGNTNPFKAYFKGQPYRVWSSTGATHETQRWNLNLTGFGGPMIYKLVVDVSTNYPNPPSVVVDNAPEPVRIETFIERYLTTSGGNSLIEVTFLDWQGPSEIKCKIESPQLFNSAIQLFYSRPGPNPNEYIFSGTISNSLLAPEGEYDVLIAAWDIPKDIHVFAETTAIVSDSIPATGNLIWAKRAGGVNDDNGNEITVLSDDSTVATGSFVGSATFGLGEPNETHLICAGGSDIYIARYNADGLLSWAKSAGGGLGDFGRTITNLSNNSIVASGVFSGTATFGAGDPNQTVLTSAGGFDIFVARYNPDKSLRWAKRAGGLSYDDDSLGITTLSDDSTVVTGYFKVWAIFGPEEPNQTVLNSVGSHDIFIARYNPNGTLAWAKRAGGTGSDWGYGITTLSDDSIVITGLFFGSCTFGQGEPNETIITSVGRDDIFIARYNSDGTIAWAKSAGGTDYSGDEGRAITSLTDDSIVVTGYFSYTATFGSGEPNETVLSSNGSSDIFIARYSANGTLVWAKNAGGSYPNYGLAITSLSDNSIALTGYFRGSATFGSGEPNQTILTSFGSNDVFVARYGSNGTLKWAKHVGGTDVDLCYGVIGLSDNSIVATGLFIGTATFGSNEPNETILTSAGGRDIFIARFAP